MTTDIKLKKVSVRDIFYLYDSLSKRPLDCAISHKKMPTFFEHCSFFFSNPYPHWYTIRHGKERIGNAYLTDRNEIGVFLDPGWRGKTIGRVAISELMALAKKKYYLANIAPGNSRSKAFFKSLGFDLIQETYRKDVN